MTPQVLRADKGCHQRVAEALRCTMRHSTSTYSQRTAGVNVYQGQIHDYGGVHVGIGRIDTP